METILDYLEDYRIDKKRDHYAPHTIKQYSATVENFADWLLAHADDLDIVQTDEGVIKDYLTDLRDNGAKQTTLVFQAAALKSYFGYLLDKDIIHKNPLRKIKIAKPDPHIEILSPEEIRKLLAAPDVRSDLGVRSMAIYTFLYDTGCRVSELVKLSIEDVSFDNAQAIIQNSKSKAKDWRAVELDPKNVNALKRWLKIRERYASEGENALFISLKSGKRLKLITVQRQFYADLTKANLRRVGIHTLRHSSIAHRLEKGAPIEYLSKKAGHKSIATTVGYYLKFSRQHARDIEEKYGVL